MRLPLGVLFILGGVLSILPIFGLWMLPLGLMLLAVDIPLFARPYPPRSSGRGGGSRLAPPVAASPGRGLYCTGSRAHNGHGNVLGSGA